MIVQIYFLGKGMLAFCNCCFVKKLNIKNKKKKNFFESLSRVYQVIGYLLKDFFWTVHVCKEKQFVWSNYQISNAIQILGIQFYQLKVVLYLFVREKQCYQSSFLLFNLSNSIKFESKIKKIRF